MPRLGSSLEDDVAGGADGQDDCGLVEGVVAFGVERFQSAGNELKVLG